jgi:hypothetical protein
MLSAVRVLGISRFKERRFQRTKKLKKISNLDHSVIFIHLLKKTIETVDGT